MHTRIYNLTALLLLTVFLTFSVGIPVVKYLCPMMGENSIHCDMCLHAPEGTTAILSPVSPCCTSYIIAERNTTPYVKESRIFDAPLSFALHWLTLPHDLTSPTIPSQVSVVPQSAAIALERPYLLNSSLLI